MQAIFAALVICSFQHFFVFQFFRLFLSCVTALPFVLKFVLIIEAAFSNVLFFSDFHKLFLPSFCWSMRF